jgi:hypothetical protein
VIASRAEVLFPSETSTRSGFGTFAEAAMPGIIPASRAFVFEFNDASPRSGAVGEGCNAAVFMDK